MIKTDGQASQAFLMSGGTPSRVGALFLGERDEVGLADGSGCGTRVVSG